MLCCQIIISNSPHIVKGNPHKDCTVFSWATLRKDCVWIAPGIFREIKQKAQAILDVLTSIFVKYRKKLISKTDAKLFSGLCAVLPQVYLTIFPPATQQFLPVFKQAECTRFSFKNRLTIPTATFPGIFRATPHNNCVWIAQGNILGYKTKTRRQY